MDNVQTSKRRRKWPFVVAAMLLAVCGLIVFVFDPFADDYWYAAFGSDQYDITVLGSTGLHGKDAFIEIDAPNRVASVILDPQETDQVLKLFETAKARQSSDWHEVGALMKPDEDSPNLKVIAGPGIRIVVRHLVCLSYDLRPADFAAFERALKRARRHFDSDDVDRGLTPSMEATPDAYRNGSKVPFKPVPKTYPGCR